MNPEMRKPQEAPEIPPKEDIRGVVLDPDSIRALLAKIKAQEAQE